MLNALLQDLKYAARGVRRNAGFSAAAVLTLALGIGATTAIFSVVYSVLLRPLPYPDPDRLVSIAEVNRGGTFSPLADPNFNDFRDQNHTFLSMARYASGVMSVAGLSEPTRTRVTWVTRDFFTALRVQPVLGRGLGIDDARQGANPVILASYEYWRRYLGSTQDLSSIKLRIENRVYSVVGVLPEGFAFPAKSDLWYPAELDPDNPSRTSHNSRAIGRLKDGALVEQANADLSAIAQRIVRQSPEQNDYLLKDAAVVSLQSALTGQVRSPLYILLAAVSFLLLIACANVANLLLSQTSARARELAIRNALGAGRGRLVRQFIAETLLLASMGCAAGLVVAVWAVSSLLALAPSDLPRLGEVAISWPVLAFAGGMSLLVAVGLGIFTAARAASSDPGSTLGESGRGHAGTQRSQRVGRTIVAAQLAITLVLLVGAGLLGRSLLRVLSVDPGFRTENLVAMDLELPVAEGSTREAELAFKPHQSHLLSRLIDRLHTIPGIQQVAAANAVPMDGGLPDGMFLLVKPQENPTNFKEFGALAEQVERRGVADFCAVSPEYFHALGIPLVRGRFLDTRDGFDAPHAAVINQSLARTRWPNQDPIGQTIQFGNMDGDLHLLTIVGIVGDTHEDGLEQKPRPTVYVNVLQRPRAYLTVVLHAGTDLGAITAAARRILHDEAPDVPPRFRTFTQIYSASMGSRRFNLVLVGVFSLTALLLAVAGIYGVMAYGVAQRTREIGVRMALGATARNVMGMILGQGMRTILIGVIVGIAGSFAITRAIQSMLFGVEPTDPITFLTVAGVLVGVAAIACYVPARRATRVDPMVSLRYE